ncbi:MAG: F0F1 ATP synthase subunit delta [bacterium]
MIKLSSAKRYAKTIFELGEEKGLLDKFSTDFANLKQVIETVEDFIPFLANPTYDYSVREQLFSEVAGKIGLNGFIVNLVKLLMEGNKVKLLPYVCKFYQDLDDFYAGRVRGQVKTAFELSSEDINAIKAAVEKALNKKVELATEVDKDVIGGLLIKVGDVVYDGTVKKQLEILKDNLIKG